jgi:transposase
VQALVLKVHEDPVAADLIRSARAEVKFLPPYSPDMNPIEQAWSLVKELLRQVAARTWDGLIKAVAKSLSKIDQRHALAWFCHSGYAT